MEDIAALVVGPNQRIYCAGYSRPNNGVSLDAQGDFLTLCYSADGIQRWRKLYDGTGRQYDIARGLATGPDGSVFVTGESTGTDGSAARADSGLDAATLCYSADGTNLWVQRFNGQANNYDGPVAIAVDPQGRIYVQATSVSGRTASALSVGVVICYAPSGLPLWTNVLQVAYANVSPVGLRPRSQGGVVTLLEATSTLEGVAEGLIASYSESGTLRWTKQLGGVGHYGSPRGLTVAPSGKVYVADNGSGVEDGKVFAYTDDGASLWNAKFGGTIAALTLDRVGNVVAGGVGPVTRASSNAWRIVSFSPDGIARWTNQIVSSFWSSILTMCTDSAGNIHATGEEVESSQNQTPRILTAAYSMDGTVLWTNRLDSPSRPSGIAVDAAGNSYVGGGLIGNNSEVVASALIRYSPLLFIQPPTAPPAVAVDSSVTMTAPVNGTLPISYQWFFNDAPVAGAVSTTLSLSRARAEDQGTYYMVASNAFIVRTSDVVRLSVIQRPDVTLDNTRISLPCGGSTNITAAVTGVGPLAYQWRMEGTNLPNATNATLLLHGADAANEGRYDLAVTGFGGTTVSPACVVSVDPLVPPVILRSPTNTTVNLNSRLRLSVQAVSCLPLHYQWHFKGEVLAGAADASLQIASTELSDAGGCQVEVCNEVGCVMSPMAEIVVNQLPMVGAVAATTLRSQPLVLPTATLLSKARDPDGDKLRVLDVAPKSFWGSPVLLVGSNVTYTPLPGLVGSDQFSYHISDGRGGITTAAVALFVFDGAVLGLNRVDVATVPGGLRFRYRGEPGSSCRLQEVRDLSHADWKDLQAFVVPPDGVWEFVAPADGASFFVRVVSE